MNKKFFSHLSGRRPGLLGRENYMNSAVLLPIVDGAAGPDLLFEVRSKHLNRQPGEICFPGGRVEDHESDNPARAAVREAAEELGLTVDDIEVLAPLDFMVTPMGAVIYPYVGSIRRPEGIVPNGEEVESIFTVPLAYLLDYTPRRHNVGVATNYADDFPLHRVPETYRAGGWQQRWSYPTYIYEYREHFIWGITAIILHHFLSLIRSRA